MMIYPVLIGMTVYYAIAWQAAPVPVADSGIMAWAWEQLHYAINGMPRWQAIALAAINAVVVGVQMIIWEEMHSD